MSSPTLPPYCIRIDDTHAALVTWGTWRHLLVTAVIGLLNQVVVVFCLQLSSCLPADVISGGFLVRAVQCPTSTGPPSHL